VPTEWEWDPTFAFLLTAKLSGCSQEDETTGVIASSWREVDELGMCVVSLLPFKNEDVWRSSACGVDGHRQGPAIGRKPDFLGTCDFVVNLAGYFQSMLVHTSR
jgi:hypothetical protein